GVDETLQRPREPGRVGVSVLSLPPIQRQPSFVPHHLPQPFDRLARRNFDPKWLWHVRKSVGGFSIDLVSRTGPLFAHNTGVFRMNPTEHPRPETPTGAGPRRHGTAPSAPRGAQPQPAP